MGYEKNVYMNESSIKQELAALFVTLGGINELELVGHCVGISMPPTEPRDDWSRIGEVDSVGDRNNWTAQPSTTNQLHVPEPN